MHLVYQLQLRTGTSIFLLYFYDAARETVDWKTSVQCYTEAKQGHAHQDEFTNKGQTILQWGRPLYQRLL